jgi:hypothetical protein
LAEPPRILIKTSNIIDTNKSKDVEIVLNKTDNSYGNIGFDDMLNIIRSMLRF